ncbi:hypothetical protein B0H14DRAFT_3458765 [Mycena olivaceomarginata]|nr:hypothetical protein B0H14DRAFT_3458765 [Mycena olivaceomarginata]
MENFAEDCQAAWRSARERADSKGYHEDAVAIVDIVYANAQTGMSQSLRIAYPLKRVVTTWLDQISVTPSPGAGDTPEVPYTVQNCMERINMTIRANTNNQLLVRPKMQPADIQIIRDVATSSRGLSAVLFHRKIALEHA